MDTTYEEDQASAYQLADDRRQDAPEEYPDEEGPKPIGIGMFIGILAFCLFLDAIEFFTGGTIGWIVGLVGDGIILLITGWKKTQQQQFKKMLAAAGLEKVWPFNILPLRSGFWVWSYIQSRYEKRT